MTTGINLRNVRKITSQLIRAGYVIRIKSNTGRAGEYAVFRLVRNTGPLLPVCREQCLYDPNIKREVGYVYQVK